MYYNPLMFLFLFLWIFLCFKSMEKIHENNWFYDESTERWLCLAATVAGPIVLGGVYFCRFFVTCRERMEAKLAEVNKEETLIFKNFEGIKIFQHNDDCGIQAEGVLIFKSTMKNFLESPAVKAVRFLPKPNGVISVVFASGREVKPQFELNLNLGRELIAGIKTAAGLDRDSHRLLQRGTMSVSFHNLETILEVRSQGFFGGEKMYILKTSRQAAEVKQ